MLQQHTLVPQTPLMSAQVLAEEHENWREVQVGFPTGILYPFREYLPLNSGFPMGMENMENESAHGKSFEKSSN